MFCVTVVQEMLDNSNVTLLNTIIKSNAEEAVLNFFLQLIFH